MLGTLLGCGVIPNTNSPPVKGNVIVSYTWPNEDIGWSAATAGDSVNAFQNTAVISASTFNQTEIPATSYLGSRTLTVSSGSNLWTYGSWVIGGSTSSSTISLSNGLHPYKVWYKPSANSANTIYWASDANNSSSGQVYAQQSANNPYPTSGTVKTLTSYNGGSTYYGEFLQFITPKPCAITALQIITRASNPARQCLSGRWFYSNDNAMTWTSFGDEMTTFAAAEDTGVISVSNPPANTYSRLWRFVCGTLNGAGVIQWAHFYVTANFITN